MTPLLLGIFLAVPGAAGAQEAPAAAKTFLRKATAAVTLAEVLSQFEKFDRDLVSVAARFSQSVQMTETPARGSVSGTVLYAKPYRFRIEHEKPARQTVVSDGNDVWVHRHDRNQVVQAKLEDWRLADPTIDHLLRFGRYAEMLDAYAVALADGDGATTLVLTPKKKGAGDFTLRLVLAADTLFPETAEMTAGGVTMRTHFENTAFNAPVAPKDFAFAVPAEADLFMNFKPPKFAP